jgi:hypothetical protein
MLREALDPAFDPTLALPPNDDLLGELTAPKWREIGGLIQVEKKEDVKSRIGRSTDLADAVCHTLLLDAEFNQQAAPDDPRTFRYTDGTEDEGIFRFQ